MREKAGSSKRPQSKEYSDSSSDSNSNEENNDESEEEKEEEFEMIPLSEKEKNEISAKILRAELMGDDVSMHDCPIPIT